MGRNTSVQPAETQSNSTQEAAPVAAVAETSNPFASDVGSTESISTPEPIVAAAAESTAAAKPGDAAFWDLLNGEFGDLPGAEDLKLDGFYKDLTPELIKDLPTPAKQIIHNLRRANELAKAGYSKKEAEFQVKLESDRQALYQKEKDLIRREQEFAAMIEDPKVQEVLKTPEGDLPDPFTQEGIDARVKKAAAEGLRTIFAPIQKSAEDRRRELAWMEFYEANPEMQDETFRNDMGALIEERKKAGAPLSTQDAFRLVKLTKFEQAEQKRQAHERQARAASATKVARTTSTGTPARNEIPKHIKGSAALIQYFKDHPEAQAEIDASRRRAH